MRERTLIDIFGGEFHLAELEGRGRAGQPDDIESLLLDRYNVIVVEIDDVSCIGDNGAYVSQNEVFALANSKNQGAPAPGTEDRVWDFGVKQRQAIGSDDLLQSHPECVQKLFFIRRTRHPIEDVPDQVSQHL